MSKITLKTQLVRGTNYRYHLVDVQGNDIAINITDNTITSTSTDFLATSETNGIVIRPITVGDRLFVYHTTEPDNEGIQLDVTSVAENQIDFTIASGTPVSEAAGSEINIQAWKKQWEFIQAGDLDLIDGVNIRTWISKVVDDWDTEDFDIYPRIFTSIEPRGKAMAALNGWEPLNEQTQLAHRDGAMEIRNDLSGGNGVEFACFISPDLDEPTDQYFFWFDGDPELDAPLQAVTTGFMNQWVRIADSNTGFDKKGIWNYRCLEDGKTHIQGQIDVQFAEIRNIEAGNQIDSKLADGSGQLLVSDDNIAAGGDFANITLNIDSDSLFSGDVAGVFQDFTGFIEMDGKTNQQVHQKNHFLLKQPTNINNDGTGPDRRGDKTPPLTTFIGDNLLLNGLYPNNFNASERNFLRPIDVNGLTRQWPSVFTLSIIARIMEALGGTFSLIHADTFGNSSPTYFQDEVGVEQKDITIAALVNIVMAYSTYNVDGHTPGTALDLVLAWNRPGGIEPDSKQFTMSAANQTQEITAQLDPSYVAA